MAARAARSSYRELARHLGAIGAVKREMTKGLPHDCPPASAAVLALLEKYGEMRISRISELMAIDMSVTSRHVAHLAERGWVERHPDPQDGRSRLLRITARGVRQVGLLAELTTETLESHLHDWTDEDIEQLNELLGRLRSSFGDGRTQLPERRTEEDAEPVVERP